MGVRDTLRGGLVVSCQPVTGGPLDRPEIVAALAEAAVAGGAAGLRIEGLANLAAVRPRVSVPIIALVKHDLDDSPVRITPFAAEARALAGLGADVVAYDATDRVRPEPTAALVAAIHDAGALAMADGATLGDAERALAEGADIVGSTLSGYTETTDTGEPGPDLALVGALSRLGAFVMAEGRYNAPELAAAAIRAGADAVTVGSALTRLEHATGWFAEAVRGAVREAVCESGR